MDGTNVKKIEKSNLNISASFPLPVDLRRGAEIPEVVGASWDLPGAGKRLGVRRETRVR